MLAELATDFVCNCPSSVDVDAFVQPGTLDRVLARVGAAPPQLQLKLLQLLHYVLTLEQCDGEAAPAKKKQRLAFKLRLVTAGP